MNETLFSRRLWAFFVLLVICLYSLSAQAKYGGGTGEPSDPYLIYTAEQMNTIGIDSNDWDKHFKLMADIDLSGYTGTSFNIIGEIYYNSGWIENPFSGVFDGNGHTISNFSYTSTGRNYIGFFGYVDDPNAEIKNLGLIDPYVDAGTGRLVGSLVGYLGGGIVTNCYSTGSVLGEDSVGGLVGYNDHSTISNCYSTGWVSGFGVGLVGYNKEGVVINSFWDVETSEQTTSAGGSGKTTAEMQMRSTFLVWGTCGNEGIWTIDEGKDYPHLWWEDMPGEPISIPISSYGGGSGEPNDPYLIYTAEQLNAIGLFPCEWGKHFKLMADIDLSAYTYTTAVIAPDTDNTNWDFDGIPFTGVFDGAGHRILNFTIDTAGVGNDFLGLLGCINFDGEVKNLGMENVTVIGRNTSFCIGGLCGANGDYEGPNGGTIINCYSTGTVKTVRGGDAAGGLVGDNFGTISDCYSTCAVTLGGYALGGLVGYNEGTITNCYSTGTVTGGSSSEYLGGFVGDNGGTVTNCYSTGRVEGGLFMCGGLVGYGYTQDVTNSFWDTQTSGRFCSDGGTGLPTAQMQMESTFIDAGWGCEPAWTIDEGFDYPRLVWENKPGELIPPSANAGSDQFFVNVIPPKVILEGSSLCNALSFHWKQVAGPSVILEGPDNPIVSLIPTEFGVYVFELTASDGLSEVNDTVTVFIEQRYAGGAGTILNPCQIRIAEHMNEIGLHPGDWNKNFILMADIDLGTFPGTSFNIIENFTGVFDGNDHTISNFTSSNRGLFGSISGEVKDLGLIDPNLDAEGDSWSVGSLCGYNSGNITNCYVEVGSVSGGYCVGGLVGYNDGTITNCYTTTSVMGIEGVGGLVGWNYAGTINNCYSTGDVSGDDRVGGLVGDNRGTISNCTSSGTVSASRSVGGLVGWNYGTINDSDSTGNVLGDEEVGGLVGLNRDGTISDCNSLAGVTGSSHVGGLVGELREGNITNCQSTGNVLGDERVGGLCGFNYSGMISKCYAISSVGGSSQIGGLVGKNGYQYCLSFWNCYSTDAMILDCYSTGSVTGSGTVGGLVGNNCAWDGWFWRCGTISNCYSTGSVMGNSNVGGLVGGGCPQCFANSFWDIETSGQTSSDGGTGLSTDEMQTMSTFTNAGWDFVGETFNGMEDIWFIGQQDYPHLWWEGMQVPMKLTPVSLNCRSEGNWVKAHITLPEGFTVADVDSNSPAVLHSFGFQSNPPYVFVNKDKLVEIEAAFERQAVCSLAGDWPDELTVAGFLTDGNIFLGTSNVRINHPGMMAIEELASCWLQGDCIYPEIDMNRDSLVNLLDYASLMNINVEFVSE